MPSMGETMRGEIQVDRGGFDCGLVRLNLSLRSADRRFRRLHLCLIGKVRLDCIVEILLADGISLCQRSRTSPRQAGS